MTELFYEDDEEYVEEDYLWSEMEDFDDSQEFDEEADDEKD